MEHPEETLRELVDWLGEPWSDDLLRHNDVQAARGAPRISAGNTRPRDPIKTDLADRWADALEEPELAALAERTGALAGFLGYDPGAAGRAGAPLVPAGTAGRRRLLTGAVLARRQAGAGRRLAWRPAEEVVVMPEMDAAELAKRLRRVEAALARMRSRRAVRWTNAAAARRSGG